MIFWSRLSLFQKVRGQTVHPLRVTWSTKELKTNKCPAGGGWSKRSQPGNLKSPSINGSWLVYKALVMMSTNKAIRSNMLYELSLNAAWSQSRTNNPLWCIVKVKSSMHSVFFLYWFCITSVSLLWHVFTCTHLRGNLFLKLFQIAGK